MHEIVDYFRAGRHVHGENVHLLRAIFSVANRYSRRISLLWRLALGCQGAKLLLVEATYFVRSFLIFSSVAKYLANRKYTIVK